MLRPRFMGCFLGSVMLVGIVLNACGRSSGPSAGGAGGGGDLTVYSGQHEQTVRKLVTDFEARTHATVALRSGDEGDLANQLLQEGKNSPADVYFAENPPALNAVSARKLLAPVDPAALAVVPPADSSPSGDWVGVTARTSALVYNTKSVTETDLPGSIMDLAKPAWKDRVALAPGETDFRPVVTAVIKLNGAAAAKQWLQGLKANARIYSDNEAVVAAVNRGERAVGLLDHYYWYRLRSENAANKGSVTSALHYFAAGDAGALIDISGAGVLATSKHAALAQSFVAYLVSEPAQQIIAGSNSWEYPLRPGVKPAADLKMFPSLTPAPLTIAELGEGTQALDLLQQVGLL
jgi:iron(III) transport system substrate-binding protein